MDHREYIRISDHKQTAVLMIHGIIGSLRHFDMLIPLIPAEWSIYNILLDGHGKRVEDFAESSMKKWRDQVTAITDRLCREYEQVVLVGHSMGTLLAVEQALRYPQHIPAVILLAAPLNVRLKGQIVRNSLKAIYGRVNPDDPVAVATQNATSVSPDRRLWRYLCWVPRFWELLVRIRATRALIPQITVPTYVFQSRKDELVSPKSARHFAGNDRISVRFLEQSGHFYYPEADLAILQEAVAAIIHRI